jgi:hypothetical protein
MKILLIIFISWISFASGSVYAYVVEVEGQAPIAGNLRHARQQALACRSPCC